MQQAIAETMLGLVEELVECNIGPNLGKIGDCVFVLELVFRRLSKPQRQRWVSLLVKPRTDPGVRQEKVIEKVMQLFTMIWLFDDDPGRTYAEAEKQLRCFGKSSSTDVRRQLLRLCNR